MNYSWYKKYNCGNNFYYDFKKNPNPVILNRLTVAIITTFLFLSVGCSLLPSSGPHVQEVTSKNIIQPDLPIQVIDITDAIVKRLYSSYKFPSFSDYYSDEQSQDHLLGFGDAIEISVWESPPAVLFGSVTQSSSVYNSGARVVIFPVQIVEKDGTINVPFVGVMIAVGKSLRQIEQEIAKKISEKAHQPHVIARIVNNASSIVTVVGEVGSSIRMPITAKGERLLDAIAAAGGVRQPVEKITIQLTRGKDVKSVPLTNIITDPKQNIILKPGDIITAIHKPLSFTVLGALGKNDEIQFEAQGISLAQALARSGGLNDNRADAKGVFIFRYENPNLINLGVKEVKVDSNGKVPVIYRLDLKEPASFFLSQNFPVLDKDVLYVSNAPYVEFQKFLNMVLSITNPSLSIMNRMQ